MELQVRKFLEAVRRALALAGVAPADVVKLNVYTTDCRAFHKTQPGFWRQVQQGYANRIGAASPASLALL
jgi:enamine deaminase RidA (YjgF/YER057c/UK114 family)